MQPFSEPSLYEFTNDYGNPVVAMLCAIKVTSTIPCVASIQDISPGQEGHGRLTDSIKLNFPRSVPSVLS